MSHLPAISFFIMLSFRIVQQAEPFVNERNSCIEIEKNQGGKVNVAGIIIRPLWEDKDRRYNNRGEETKQSREQRKEKC